ncbi:MAG: alpha/beta hydrolase [Gammaproteobacteria bacterium]|nr:alpha/beta hydrolase [Gammaproteobacteria bacterium]
MSIIFKLLIYLSGAYALLCIYVYFMQSSLIFYPDIAGRELVTTPEMIGLAYQDIELHTEDNIKLHGWFIPNKNAKGTVLFFHGNAGNISHRLDSIDIFHRMDLNVFIIDYRGYGQSEGDITENGTYQDAEAAWKYLTHTQGISDNKIIIFGQSLGASIAGWLASRHTPAALIIESGFTSVPAMGQRLYPFLPVRWLARYQYNTKQYVSAVACPVMVAHSKDDEIIPYDEGREIFDAAPEPKRFLEMRGGHNDGFMVSGSDYTEGLKSFIHGNMK